MQQQLPHATRPPTLWRYRELLPYADASCVVSLGRNRDAAGPLPRAGRRDSGCRTCGSRTNRGFRPAVSKAAAWQWLSPWRRNFGIRRLAIPTAGNAGGALAAYAARAGSEAFVFMPDDTPAINQYECHQAGAKTFLVPELITDCGRIVREGKDRRIGLVPTCRR